MRKTVFVFPGVGSQYVGMAKRYYEEYKVFRQTLEEAGDVSGKDFSRLCFGGAKAAEISELENAQLLLFTLGVGYYRVYMETIGIAPSYCMGHSLGEYSALCSAQVFSFIDGIEIVKQRGTIIREVAAGVEGTMMWVINLEKEKVEAVCRDVSGGGEEVHISAYDCPTQTSISGHNGIIMTAARKLQDLGAIVYPLKMSGPFHSPLMKIAAERMREFLRTYENRFSEPLYPVIANRHARPYEGKASVVENLSLQLVSPIRWLDSVRYLEERGITVAVEMGPKDVLKFLIKKTTDTIRPYTLDKEDDVSGIKQVLVVPEEEYLEVVGRCLGVAVSIQNRNRSIPRQVYEKQVITPYNRVASFYEALQKEGKTPNNHQVKEALNMVQAVMSARRVPGEVKEKGMEKILGGRTLR